MASQSLSNLDLPRQVALVARRARLWLVVMAASAMAVGFLAAALVCGALDYLFRFDEPAWRLALTLAGPLAAMVAGWLFLWPALRTPLSEKETAKRLERFFPALRGRLANSLEFLRARDEDPRAGSGELRWGVVQETTEAVSRLPLVEAIDARLPKAFAALAAACLAALAVFSLASPQTLSLGARRLAAPWGDDVWPRRHRLQFVDPVERIAAGDDVELIVVDKNGRLPSDLRLEYRLGKGEVQSAAMDVKAANRAAARINNVSQSLVYRAVGGDDDDGPWRKVEALSPVRITSLEVTVRPPGYTSLPARTSTASIRALRGSRVQLAGAANQRLSSATLFLDGPRASQSIELELSANRRKFFTPQSGPSDEAPASAVELPNFDGLTWLVRESGSWRLRLVNERGIGLGAERERRELGEVQALPDEPPSIAMSTAMSTARSTSEVNGSAASSAQAGVAADREARSFARAIATANASAPVSAIVKDDFGIATVRLEYRIAAPATSTQAEAAQEEMLGVVELFRGPLPATPFERGQELSIDHPWDLREIANLQPGQTIVWKLAAEDYLGQGAVSSEQTLAILSPEEVENRLLARRRLLLASLQETLRAQIDARSQTAGLASAMSSPAGERIQAAEQSQRAVRERATDTAAEAASLGAAFERNRLPNEESVARFESLSQMLDALLAVELANAEAGLATLVREAELEGALPTSDAQAAIVAEQDRAIATLERQIAELDSWAARHRLSQELAELRKDQSGLLEGASRLRLETLSAGGSPDENQTAEVARLADEQRNLSRRFDKIQSRLEELSGDTAEDTAEDTDGELAADADRSNSELLAAALQAARRAGLDEVLRKAAAALAERRLGEAEGHQRQALSVIDEMLAQDGQDRQPSSTEGASRQQQFNETLAQFAEQLSATIDAQRRLVASAESAAPQAGELATEETKLARQTRDLATPFDEAEAILFAIGSAAESMERAAKNWRSESALAGIPAARAALARLEQLQVSLQAASPSADSNVSASGEAAGGEAGDSPEGDSPSGRKFLLAQLKFLLAAQQSLSQRTREIESSSAARQETLAEIAVEIAAEQETLARLIGSLAQQIQESPAERQREAPRNGEGNGNGE